ncbi:MAG: hypothetical protein JJU05_00675 [Verrucomicrobia bacterium]|nr:hypothetical protein [Verrucomicrobiota bacterium]MCH8526341.1 hypothetical protein [Kiritimatiellia bacterium]
MDNTYLPRKNYGAYLEPEDRVLHGAGQSTEAFEHYVNALGGNSHPALFMHYCGLRNMPGGRMAALDGYHEAYPDAVMIPQIGLSMTKDGSPEQHYEQEVAAGLHDEAVANLIERLRTYGRPVFLRIGYEFNGQWNGYEPETFVAAWRRIVDAMRAADLRNVATVWCYAEDGVDKEFPTYYPGDDYVDWWGIDVFDAEHMSAPGTLALLKAAEAHGKPVMIGESTSRRVGVHDGAESWAAWYAPYFGLIRSQPGIKAFCYINWNWAAYPMWHDWGDCRIEANAEVLARYRGEMGCGLYQHG